MPFCSEYHPPKYKHYKISFCTCMNCHSSFNVRKKERKKAFLVSSKWLSFYDKKSHLKKLAFALQVVASEDGHDDVVVDVTVFLLDLNDNSPYFDKETYACDVFENSVGGTPVCQLTVCMFAKYYLGWKLV